MSMTFASIIRFAIRKSRSRPELRTPRQQAEHRQTVFRAATYVGYRGGLCDHCIERNRLRFGFGRRVGERAAGVAYQQRPRRHCAECKCSYTGIINAAAEIYGGQVNATPPRYARKCSAERPIGERDVQGDRDLAGSKRSAAIALNEVNDRDETLARRADQFH